MCLRVEKVSLKYYQAEELIKRFECLIKKYFKFKIKLII